jgi:hypothetical protein
MKTGFYRGFANRPRWVTYDYHGVPHACRKTPFLDPFILVETIAPLPLIATWELVYTVALSGYPDWAAIYNVGDFYPSTGIDGCDVTFPDGFSRVYAYHAHLVTTESYMIWNTNGEYGCDPGGGYTEDPTVDARGIGKIYAGDPSLVSSWEATTGSVVRIWRSTNGELPEGNPPWE